MRVSILKTKDIQRKAFKDGTYESGTLQAEYGQKKNPQALRNDISSSASMRKQQKIRKSQCHSQPTLWKTEGKPPSLAPQHPFWAQVATEQVMRLF